jgi:hypothetical protein
MGEEGIPFQAVLVSLQRPGRSLVTLFLPCHSHIRAMATDRTLEALRTEMIKNQFGQIQCVEANEDTIQVSELPA